MHSLPTKIMRRIRGHGRGDRVYRPKDFLDLGSRAAIDQTLSRLVSGGQIRRLARGLYDYPRVSGVLKRPVPPSAAAVATAVAGRNAHVLPGGMASANSLGLTTAVSSKASFITDGHARDVRVGGLTVRVDKASRRLQPWMGRPGAMVVQALDWLGRDVAHDSKIVGILQSRLPDDVKRDLWRGIGDLPGWAQPIVRQLAPDADAAT